MIVRMFLSTTEHAQSLSHEERKGYAEKVGLQWADTGRSLLTSATPVLHQVVMAFWNAIGGDEEEVEVDSDS